MDRSRPNKNSLPRWSALALCLAAAAPSTGCLHQILATGIYLFEGGNLVDGECDALEDQKVVVFCRPPSASGYSHAGASRELAKRVSSLLAQDVPGIDVVDPREVDAWLDENDSDDFRTLGEAVGADRVLRIEFDHFGLFNGKTLYQGNADVTIAVYDMRDGGRLMWDKPLGEVLFPRNSGVPVQDKSERQFQREFVEIVASAIARHFHRHDPHADFAIDALANR